MTFAIRDKWERSDRATSAGKRIQLCIEERRALLAPPYSAACPCVGPQRRLVSGWHCTLPESGIEAQGQGLRMNKHMLYYCDNQLGASSRWNDAGAR